MFAEHGNLRADEQTLTAELVKTVQNSYKLQHSIHYRSRWPTRKALDKEETTRVRPNRRNSRQSTEF